MGNAGLSKSRLERMHHVLSGFVDRQEIPGRRANDRHPLHAAYDGFAGTTKGLQRFLDAGIRSHGISKPWDEHLPASASRCARLLSELAERTGWLIA
jgi:hypothetical protein